MRRSWLVAPIYKENHLQNAIGCGADIYHPDLEDSVPRHKKHSARSLLAAVVQNQVKPVAVRINSIGTWQGLKDILYMEENSCFPDIMIIPDASIMSDVKILERLFQLTDRIPEVYLVIESVASIYELQRVDGVPDFVKGVIFGSADLAVDLEIDINFNEYDFGFLKREVVFHAKRLNLDPIDSPCFNIDSDEELLRDCLISRRLGFKGKIAIHPSQVSIINDIFSLSSDLDQWSKAVIEKDKDASSSLSKLDSMLIGPPFVKLAWQIRKKLDG